MQRRRFRLSERAADDLTAIYDYIADFNSNAARRVIGGIKAKISSIAALGLTGASRDDLRVVVFRNDLIYVRVTPSYLFIARILHGRQGMTSEDFPESEI